MPREIVPGEELTQELAIGWPQQPGSYRLEVDLVREDLAWFGDAGGGPLLAGEVEIQVVALTGWPVVGPAGAAHRRLLGESIDLGVDRVGGCPHLEDDPDAATEVFLEAAAAAGLGLDLHTDETLIALSVCAAGNEIAKRALDALPLLKGCELHSTVVLPAVDASIFKKLGVNCTCEPVYETKKLYRPV